MPVGAANLFSATDPKLAVYDYATSFFGGVAPLVSIHTALYARMTLQGVASVAFCSDVNTACSELENSAACRNVVRTPIDQVSYRCYRYDHP